MARTVSDKTHGQRSARAAMEMSDRGARIAILSRHKGRFLVNDLVEVDFPPAPEGQPLTAAAKAGAIRDALKSHGWRLSEIVLVLPKNLVTMRLVMLPSINDAELPDMARFEAQKHIPFNVERHVIAHGVLRKEGVEGSRTLIVAVDRAALEEPLAVCRETKFDVTSARVSSLALVEALLLDPPAGYAEQTFALVNVGWSTVDITIVSGGMVRFTRSGTIGLDRAIPFLQKVTGPKAPVTRETLASVDALDPSGFFERRGPVRRPAAAYTTDDFGPDDMALSATEAAPPAEEPPSPTASPEALAGPAGELAKWLGRLVQEIQRTHNFAEREFECPQLESVYLAGIGSYMANVTGYLQRSLRCPVTLINPPASVEFATPKGRDLRAAWREYAITIGAVAGTSLPPVNLVPPEYAEGIQARKRKRARTITGTLLVLLIAAALTYHIRWLQDQRHQLEFYKSHNSTLAPRVKNLRDRERRLRIVKEIVEDPRSAGAILEKLSRLDLVQQRKITLLEFQYTKSDKVRLDGHARGYPELDKFVEQLEKLTADAPTSGSTPERIFESVQQKSRPLFTMPGNRGTVVRFNLECLFPKK